MDALGILIGLAALGFIALMAAQGPRLSDIEARCYNIASDIAPVGRADKVRL
jgi:hypothetical protein